MGTLNENYGVYNGTVLLQQRGTIGGSRSVFVGLKGNKNDLVLVPTGGIVQNPFKSKAKIFAGDLIEFIPNYNGATAKCYLLKTFTVAEDVVSSTVNLLDMAATASAPTATALSQYYFDTTTKKIVPSKSDGASGFEWDADNAAAPVATAVYVDLSDGSKTYMWQTNQMVLTAVVSGKVYIKRSGYTHKPETGVMYMKAPSTKDATGTAGSFYSVVEKTIAGLGDVYECTMNGSESLGSLAENDILVESDATAAGAGASALVKNPNTVAPYDYDFLFEPATGDEDFDGARYMMTPVLHSVMIKSKMSAIPAYVELINKSLIQGWFEL